MYSYAYKIEAVLAKSAGVHVLYSVQYTEYILYRRSIRIIKRCFLGQFLFILQYTQWFHHPEQLVNVLGVECILPEGPEDIILHYKPD